MRFLLLILPGLLMTVVLSDQVEPKQGGEWVNVRPGLTKTIEETSAFRKTRKFERFNFYTDHTKYVNIACVVILPCDERSHIKAINYMAKPAGYYCTKSDTEYKTIPTMSSKYYLSLELYSGDTSDARYKCNITVSTTPLTTTTAAPTTTTPRPCNCGTLGAPKVAGGAPVLKGAVPWQVAIGSKVSSKFIMSCGGTVISAAHVITAAHCVQANDTTIKVFMGDVDLKSASALIVDVSRVEQHDSYNPTTLENDIAFIAFTKLVKFNEFMFPICLPKKFSSETFDGKNLLVSGWGEGAVTANKVSDLLHAVSVKGISNAACGNSYTPSLIKDTMLCATTASNYTSVGDVGGPLTYTENSISYLIGVVSRGNSSSLPGVYTRVTSYLDWIDEKTELPLCSK